MDNEDQVVSAVRRTEGRPTAREVADALGWTKDRAEEALEAAVHAGALRRNLSRDASSSETDARYVSVNRPSAIDLRARAGGFNHGTCVRCNHDAKRHHGEPDLDIGEEGHWKLVCWGPRSGEQCSCRIRVSIDQ